MILDEDKRIKVIFDVSFNTLVDSLLEKIALNDCEFTIIDVFMGQVLS